MRRVVITGIGIISPLGNAAPDFFACLMAGKSGIRRISSDFSHRLTTQIAAEVDFNQEEHFHKKTLRSLDRVSQFALAAASQAWKDSGINPAGGGRKRMGVAIGTGTGGSRSIEDNYIELFQKNAERVNPLSVILVMNNAAASHISIEYGLEGPCHTFSTACSSAAIAIGEAYRQIKDGYADVMLAGGTESLLTYGVFKAWESLGTLAKEADDPSTSFRPFSKDRSGFVLGEGAAILSLELLDNAVRRGAHIYGEVIGYSSTSEASHITKPSVDGQAWAMVAALEDAKIHPDNIDYINAHGTATLLNDLVETQAIKKVFGEKAYKVPVSSTKSMHGHLLGATGAVELVASVLAILYQAVPPTANLMVPDPECDLDYVPGKGRTGMNITTVMSNSFAFGGTNAVLIVRKYNGT